MPDLSFLQDRRVAVLTNIPRPYRLPLYALLNQDVLEAGGQFRLFYYSNLSRHARRRGSYSSEGNFPSEFIDGLELSLGFDRLLSLPTGLFRQLRRFNPHVMICGSFGLPGYLAWAYSIMHHIPYIQWSGAWEGATSPGAGRRYRLHQGFLARRADACVTYGTQASRYLSSLGVPEKRIVTGVNTVDGAYFQQQVSQRAVEAAQFRRQHSLPDINLLYVGSLNDRKGASQLLEAFLHLPESMDVSVNKRSIFHQDHREREEFTNNSAFSASSAVSSCIASTDAALHFVGGGPLEAGLRQRAGALGWQSRVFFWGQQPPQELPLYYALASVFIFPSLYEPWGLVLNEAMACGLPVIASSLAGATSDLVQDGFNGLVVDPRDPAALAQALSRLLADPDLRQRMGQAARETIQRKATLEHSAQAFLRALEITLQIP